MNPEMSGAGSGGEAPPQTSPAVPVHVEEKTVLDPKESSPQENTDNPSTPKKAIDGKARRSTPRPVQESPPPSLTKRSPRTNADETYAEANTDAVQELTEREEDANPPGEIFPMSGKIETLDNRATPLMYVPDKATESSCSPIVGDGTKVVPPLGLLALDVSSTPCGSPENIHRPSTLVALQSSEEAVLTECLFENTSPCGRSKDTLCSSAQGTRASDVSRSNDEAHPASPAVLIPLSPKSSSSDAASETETDATVARDQSIEDAEEFKIQSLGDRQMQLSGSQQSTDANYSRPQSPPAQLQLSTEHGHACLLAHMADPDAGEKRSMVGIPSRARTIDKDLDHSVVYEDELGTSDPLDSEAHQHAAEVPSCDANELRGHREVHLSDHGNPEEGDTKLGTEASSTEEERSASHEASRAPTDDALAQNAPNSPNREQETVHATRSRTRFSDDAIMLREFLSRAQARKAARELSSPAPAPAPAASLRRSPRKSLAEIGHNSPSRDKPRDLRKRPGTPPGSPKLEMDDLDEDAPEPTSCRRSTRTRLFTPARPAPGAPSLIPVRRADGVDNIVLQRSSAQRLAMVTRANTRRNRGQSKPPKLVLQALLAETLPVGVVGPKGGRGGKCVGWDEPLVYYQAAPCIRPVPAVKRTRSGRAGLLDGADSALAPKKDITEALRLNATSRATGGQGRSKR